MQIPKWIPSLASVSPRSPGKENNLFSSKYEEIGLNCLQDSWQKSLNAEKPSETLLLPIIKKFIYRLKKTTSFHKFKSFQNNILSFLNDKAYFSKPKEKPKVRKKLKIVYFLFDYFLHFKNKNRKNLRFLKTLMLFLKDF